MTKVYEYFRLEGTHTPLVNRVSEEELRSVIDPQTEFLFSSVPVKVLSGILNKGIGIEIEVEHIVELDRLYEYWEGKKDGSLRGVSKEYVTPYGLRIGHSIKALKVFETCIKDARKATPKANIFTFGERTSVHVHIDLRNFDEDQLRALIIVYLLFEEPLFDYAGPSRKSNVFTIPFRDTVNMVNCPDIWDIVRGAEKYCAFNLKSLTNFGTVEFRHMEGTERFDRIFPWIMMIGLLVRFAQRVPLEEIQKQVEDIKVESQYDQFLNRVFFGYSKLLQWDPNVMDEAASDAKLFFKDNV